MINPTENPKSETPEKQIHDDSDLIRYVETIKDRSDSNIVIEKMSSAPIYLPNGGTVVTVA